VFDHCILAHKELRNALQKHNLLPTTQAEKAAYVAAVVAKAKLDDTNQDDHNNNKNNNIGPTTAKQQAGSRHRAHTAALLHELASREQQV
jgi:tartrate dehydratase beta subunit/fumarate hydratase class I family protein